jgi:hypothetical protein
MYLTNNTKILLFINNSLFNQMNFNEDTTSVDDDTSHNNDTIQEGSTVPHNRQTDNHADDHVDDHADGHADDHVDNHDDCLLCPICKDLLIIPRLYSCGHNVCEECMLTTDKVLEEESNYSIPLYRCPICREETLQKWYDRPVNNTLIDVLCKISSEYQIRHNNHKKRQISDIPEKKFPPNVNIAYISQRIREYKAEALYNQIIPILYRAAIDGKSYVTITTGAHDISVVADILAKKLIERNGIYKFTSVHRECQIELVPSERTYRCEFDNPNYNTTDSIISINNGHDQNNETTQSSSIEDIHVDDVLAVTVTDISGNQISDPESRQLSNFLVNHVLRNLSNQSNLSNL